MFGKDADSSKKCNTNGTDTGDRMQLFNVASGRATFIIARLALGSGCIAGQKTFGGNLAWKYYI